MSPVNLFSVFDKMRKERLCNDTVLNALQQGHLPFLHLLYGNNLTVRVVVQGLPEKFIVAEERLDDFLNEVFAWARESGNPERSTHTVGHADTRCLGNTCPVI